ncbi:MAG: DUF2141 domain-containing protein [Pirellula sp.]|jgi:uncharacterized protein (DUF2141 family)|nr:DUF2141 domain-containing protein [Pirellula sp.]
MAKIRSISATIFLMACLAACESGCSRRDGKESRTEQEQTTSNSASSGEVRANSTTFRNASQDPAADLPNAAAEPLYDKNQARTFRISVRGFASTSGSCRIAVYSNSASFNQPDKAALRIILPIGGESVIWEPSDEEMVKLPEAVAIAAFQDVNENEKLDKNSLGIPTERYGFSNNPKRGFGPPSFQQAKFTLSTGINTLDIEIR